MDEDYAAPQPRRRMVAWIVAAALTVGAALAFATSAQAGNGAQGRGGTSNVQQDGHDCPNRDGGRQDTDVNV